MLAVVPLVLAVGAPMALALGRRRGAPAAPIADGGLPHISLRGAGSALGAHELIRCTPRGKAPKGLVIFVPGNPGMPSFYADYACRLCELLAVEVVVLGLAGHLTHGSAAKLGRRERGRSFGVSAQVEHVADRSAPLLRAAQAAGLPCCIAAHSIGSYIAFEAAARLGVMPGQDAADAPAGGTPRGSPRGRDARSPARRRPAAPGAEVALLGLMPFLSVAEGEVSASVASKRPILQRFGWALTEPLAATGALLRLAPRALLDASLRAAEPGMRAPFAAHAADAVLHAGAVRNLLVLARDEMKALAPRFDFARRLGPPSRLRLLYVEDDEWAPVGMAARAREAGVRADVLPNRAGLVMKHAFSVGDVAVQEEVAAWTAAQLCAMLGLRVVTAHRSSGPPRTALSSSAVAWDGPAATE